MPHTTHHCKSYQHYQSTESMIRSANTHAVMANQPHESSTTIVEKEKDVLFMTASTSDDVLWRNQHHICNAKVEEKKIKERTESNAKWLKCGSAQL